MRIRQIFGYLLLTVAGGFAVYKINQSDLMEHVTGDWYSFIGFIAIVLLLGMAVVRVLRD